MSDPVTSRNGARFLAERSKQAGTFEVGVPLTFALPGSLTPISKDRLEAHQDDGLLAHQIVDYENERFLQVNEHVRERHRQWVARDYDAMVRVERELQAERMAKEAHARAEYQARLAAILEAKDSEDA